MGKNVRIKRGKSDGASRVAGENPSLEKRVEGIADMEGREERKWPFSGPPGYPQEYNGDWLRTK
jgi:hypothetical protein